MDLMSMASIVLKSLDPKECRSIRPLVLVVAAACSIFLLGTVYAKMVETPRSLTKVNEHLTATDGRLTELETSGAITAEKLKAISATLERIEQNSVETRRDVSDLKTALIRK